MTTPLPVQEPAGAANNEAWTRAMNAALTYRNHDPEAMDEQDAWVALINALGALASLQPVTQAKSEAVAPFGWYYEHKTGDGGPHLVFERWSEPGRSSYVETTLYDTPQEAVERQPLTGAAYDVLAERRHQISQRGWTPEHDDEHWVGDLSLAGAVYAVTKGPRSDVPPAWPWEAAAFKPRDWRANLVRAGALILAEIERLDRAKSKACADPMCACRGGPCVACPEGREIAAAHGIGPATQEKQHG